MKKLSFALLALVLFGSVFADNPKVVVGNQVWSFSIKNKREAVVRGVAPLSGQVLDERISVPSVLGGYVVTGIGGSAFARSKSLKSIALPISVRDIENRAFQGCENLEAVYLNEGLQAIEFDAFNGCKSLKAINLPSTLSYIGHGCFSRSGLESVEIPDYVVKMGDSTFAYCANLKTVSIGYGLKVIPGTMCGNCPMLDTLTIKEGYLTIVGGSAFNGCKRLRQVALPSRVETIENRAFQGCENLEAVYLNEGLKAIEFNAFNGCKSLKAINLPSTLSYIGNGCFTWSGLESVEIPDYVVKMGGSTFAYCANLKTVSIGYGLKVIPAAMCDNCPMLDTLTIKEGYLTIVGGSAFNGCKRLRQVALPSRVETIENRAFQGCENLEAVYLNEGLKAIEFNAFNGCKSLKAINLPSTLSHIGNGCFSRTPVEKTAVLPR